VFSLVRFGQPESVHAVGSMKSTTYARTKGNADLIWYWWSIFGFLLNRHAKFLESFTSSIFQPRPAICWSEWPFRRQLLLAIEESGPRWGLQCDWDAVLLRISWLSDFEKNQLEQRFTRFGRNPVDVLPRRNQELLRKSRFRADGQRCELVLKLSLTRCG